MPLRGALPEGSLGAQFADEPGEYRAGEVVAERYRLVRPLGRGGMGVVWQAEALMLGVEVAIKFVMSDSDRGILDARLEREAHAAASCHHPALVRMFDFGRTAQENPYLVMELVGGASLSSMLNDRGRMPATEAVRIILPIADGLRVAHQNGIVHRDVKPDNILIETDERGNRWPKLLDFGIAKVSSVTNWDMTEDGATLGTPDYMSPEQALGQRDVGAASDVWSLCATLYYLLVGNTPFRRTTYNALVQAILHEPVKPITDFGVGDAKLWQILERGFSKEPRRRTDSMTRLGAALADWLMGHSVTVDCSGKSLQAIWPEPSCHELEAPGVEPDGAQFTAPSELPLAGGWSGELPRHNARIPSVRPLAWVSGALAVVAAIGVPHYIRFSPIRHSEVPVAGVAVGRTHSEPAAPQPAEAGRVVPPIADLKPPAAPIAPAPSASSVSPAAKSTKPKLVLRSRYHNFGF